MAIPVAHKVKGSMLKATISSTLTEIPGLQNLEADFGENITFENSDISSDYVAPVFSGVRGMGSFSADIINDPLGSVHQFLQDAYNDGDEVVGSITLGATGVVILCKYIITKFPVSGKKNEGFLGKIEGVFTEKVSWNTADPV